MPPSFVRINVPDTFHVYQESISSTKAAFVRADPESAKNTDNLIVFFVLLGSLCV